MSREQYTGAAFLLFALGLSSCGVGLSESKKDADASSATLPGVGTCPLTTAGDWRDFITNVAADDEWVATCEDSPCDPEFYAAVKKNVQDVFDSCGGLIAQNPKIATCTKNLRTFVPTWMNQHDNGSYGFTVDNRTYLKAEEGTDRPAGMMTVPPEIIAALPDPVKVVEAARLNGWRYITHNSALAPHDAIPTVGARTFVYKPDPSGKFDQWMLLNLGDGTTVNTVMPLSFIGVQKTDATGQKLAKIRLNFRDFNISKDAAGTYSVSARDDGNGKCYSCHPSGLRKLIDYRTPVLEAKPVKGEAGFQADGSNVPADFGFKRLKELNAIIEGYGLPDWDGMIVPENHGPALGKDQGCTACHNGESRGLLTVSTSIDQIEKKIYYQLAMPAEADADRLLEGDALKNPPLSAADQVALNALLEKHDLITTDFENARFPALQSWMTETACE